MSSINVDSLTLEIKTSASEASSSIQALASSLATLKNATKGGLGLTSVAKNLTQMNAAMASMKTTGLANMNMFTKGLTSLSAVGKVNISSTIPKRINEIGQAVDSIGPVTFNKLERLAKSLNSLSKVGKFNLGNAASQIKRFGTDNIGSVSRTSSASVKDLMGEISNSSSKFNSAQRSAEAFASSIVNMTSKIGLAYIGIQKIVTSIGSFISSSNDYQEMLNLFNTSMGVYASEAKDYADKVASIVGIDPAQWMQNQGTFMSITKGFGIGAENAYIMSQNLTQLGYDIASFRNLDFEDAMLRVQSGLAGELEPLRRIGYDLSQATLQQVAYNHGLRESYVNMTQSEKAQLRYIALMEQMTFVQGDMGKTLQAPANQIRVLRAQFTMLAREIGNIFIPAVVAILPYLLALVKILRSVAAAIAKFVGFKITEIDWDGTTEAASSVADNTEDTSNNLKKATRNAKKLKNYLLGIDELNVIAPEQPTQSSGNGGGAGAGGAGGAGLDLDLPQYDFLKGVNMQAESLVKKVKAMLNTILALAGAAALALGILLVLGGQFPLGIALIAVGATSLAAALTIDWDKPGKSIRGFLSSVLTIAGAAFLALGLILLLSPMSTPIGIALIATGAMSLIGSAVIDLKGPQSKVKKVLGLIAKIAGTMLLALGVMAIMTGVGIPIGIGLIIAGAASLAASQVINHKTILNKLKGGLTKIKNFVLKHDLVFGAIMCLTGLGFPVGVGLIIHHFKKNSKSSKVDNGATAAKNVKAGVKTVTNAFNGLKTGIVNKIDSAKSVVQGFGTKIKNWFNKGKNGTTLASYFKSKGKSIISSVKSGLADSTTRNTAYDSLATFNTNLKGHVGSTGFKDKGESIITAVKSGLAVQTHRDDAYNSLSTFNTNLKGKVGDSGYKDKGKDMISAVKSGVGNSTERSNAYSKMSSFASNLKGKFAIGKTTMYSAMKTAGGNVLSGIYDGITGKKKRDSIYSALTNLASTMWKKFKKTLGIKSPSRVFAATARFIPQGVAVGINDEAPMAIKAVTDFANEIASVEIQPSGLDASMLDFIDASSIDRQVELTASGVYAHAITVDGFADTMEEMYQTYVEPALKRIGEDVKRQADKDPKTVVSIGKRDVYNANNAQKKANGYSFA